MSGPSVGRLGDGSRPPSPGVRVVLDVRPLQAPERAPLAAGQTFVQVIALSYEYKVVQGVVPKTGIHIN